MENGAVENGTFVQSIRNRGESGACPEGCIISVEKGEFVAIIGQSGSGKSTLLHMIGGVDVPSSGHVWVDGSDVYARNRKELAIFRRRQVGLIYQFYNLIPVLNVVDNMTLPVKLDGQKVNRERLEELLDILDLRDRAAHLPRQLSGGQQQRAAIGRALLYAPPWFWQMNPREIWTAGTARRL